MPAQRARERARVGIDEELARVEAQALGGRPGAVHAVAVELAGADVEARVEDAVGAPRQLDPLALDRRVRPVEETQLDDLRVGRGEREVRAAAVPARAERFRQTLARASRTTPSRVASQSAAGRAQETSRRRSSRTTRSWPRSSISFAARDAAADDRLGGERREEDARLAVADRVDQAPGLVRDRQRAVALRGELDEPARLEARRHQHAVGRGVEPARRALVPGERRVHAPREAARGGGERVGDRALAVAEQRDRRAGGDQRGQGAGQHVPALLRGEPPDPDEEAAGRGRLEPELRQQRSRQVRLPSGAPAWKRSGSALSVLGSKRSTSRPFAIPIRCARRSW